MSFVKIIRRPAAQFESGLILDDDQIAVETDTLKEKIGDGATTWANLPYRNPTGLVVATGAEVDTGTNNTKFLSPLALADSDYVKEATVTAAIAAALLAGGKRARVRGATTAAITIATALNNGDTLDGLTLVTGDLILVKDQAAPAQNGIYVVGASPARSAEFDTYDEHPGSLIAVTEGTANNDTLWLCTSNLGGTLDTTAIDFSSLLNTSGVLRSYLATTVTYNADDTLGDTPLSVTVAAGGIYDINLVVHSTSAVKALNMDFAGTATIANFIGQWDAFRTAAVGDPSTGIEIYPLRVSAVGTDFTTADLDAVDSYWTFTGSVEITDAGTFLLRGAQNVSDASNTTILRGSTLKLTKMN